MAEGRDPGEAIREGENALRDLVEEVLEPALGKNWLDQSGLTPERMATLRKRHDDEQKGRSLHSPEERLLYYGDLFDLRKVIDKHWEKFKPFLGDKKQFDVFIDRLEDFRNPHATSVDCGRMRSSRRMGLAASSDRR